MNNIAFHNLTDEQLVSLYKLGNAKAIDVLYTRYYTKVLRKCMSFLIEAEDANDLAQEIMIKIITNILLFKSDGKFSTWIFTIAHNHCIDYFRKKKKVQMTELDNNYPLVEEENDEEDNSISIELFGVLLNEICEKDRALLVMKYLDKYSIKQIQEELQLSTSAVKMRLKRAKEKVLKQYQRNYLHVPAA